MSPAPVAERGRGVCWDVGDTRALGLLLEQRRQSPSKALRSLSGAEQSTTPLTARLQVLAGGRQGEGHLGNSREHLPQETVPREWPALAFPRRHAHCSDFHSPFAFTPLKLCFSAC